jgi:DNA-binding MarR family transcriptional regulator
MSRELRETDLDAWRAFLNAHAAAVGRIEEEVAREGGVPLVDYDVLVALEHAPGQRLRLRDLQRRVVLTRSGITRLVDRLEAAGLLRRERLDGDRRAVHAVLTDAGKAAIRRTWPAYARGIRQYFVQYLSPEHVAVLAAELQRVAAQAHEEPSGVREAGAAVGNRL